MCQLEKTEKKDHRVKFFLLTIYSHKIRQKIFVTYVMTDTDLQFLHLYYLFIFQKCYEINSNLEFVRFKVSALHYERTLKRPLRYQTVTHRFHSSTEITTVVSMRWLLGIWKENFSNETGFKTNLFILIYLFEKNTNRLRSLLQYTLAKEKEKNCIIKYDDDKKK